MTEWGAAVEYLDSEPITDQFVEGLYEHLVSALAEKGVTDLHVEVDRILHPGEYHRGCALTAPHTMIIAWGDSDPP